jgi:hypothetical protein
LQRLYEILSKIFANKLKVSLPHIISNNQSAFISGHLISDNILAVYETLYTMHSHMWGNESYMVLKIDMSKAYDRVKLVFLAEVMKQLGFTSKWINLIMKCITFVRYAAIVNEQPVGHICPTKGI